ncbi:rhodanese-like domain-containing protein [uncultured Maribacter sp.]|uniref:rhodanese-like domain-containing protein n=1 Tax=uncultured Maribacter sp. TaxID=431308 RepID=UPI0034295825
MQSQSKLDKILKSYNKESVPYIQVANLIPNDSIVLLDSREEAEFNVSHIKNAIWIGYDTFNKDSISKKITNKNTPIVVYCSIGVRSENIGETLLKMGFTNVKNLYGGIFEWKNQDQPVYNLDQEKTEKVHAYNKHWGKLLKKGEKIYK